MAASSANRRRSRCSAGGFGREDVATVRTAARVGRLGRLAGRFAGLFVDCFAGRAFRAAVFFLGGRAAFRVRDPALRLAMTGSFGLSQP